MAHVVNERGEPGYHVDHGELARRAARHHMRLLHEYRAERRFAADMEAAEAVEALLEWLYPVRVYHIPRREMPGARLPLRAVTDKAQSYVAQLWAMLDNERGAAEMRRADAATVEMSDERHHGHGGRDDRHS